ncbi:MAG: glutamine synthetase family protein [Proteobacteria bacterium]|nr:glutamine synthetase family protein [Pseudomonadota bacterium]
MGETGRLDLETLTRLVDDGEIETIVTAFADLYGRLVGKRITGHFFLEEIARGGMHVCDYLLACDMEMDPTPGYAFTSWDTGYGDFRCLPDLGTLRRAAWLDRSAIVLCDALGEERDDLVPVAPRSILRRQLERADERGLQPQMGSELEFFLFRETYQSAGEKGYRELVTSQRYVEDYHVLSSTFAEPVIGSIRRLVDASAIPVEFSKGEWGPGQHEINLRYAPALEMADRHVIYKLAAKEIAAQQGAALTFMAKWDQRFAGNSLHIHLSLTDAEGTPVFAGDQPMLGMPVSASDTFRFVLGGMLEHAQELSLFFAPTVNSYKRYVEGTFAPTRVAYSYDNRTVGFRVVGHGPSLRVECRIPGADANPYLAYAALIAAALDGIEHQRDPGPVFSGDAYTAEGLPDVPTSLPAAIAALDQSAFARKVFSDPVIDHMLHFARTEQACFARSVTDFERARYFERI